MSLWGTAKGGDFGFGVSSGSSSYPRDLNSIMQGSRRLSPKSFGKELLEFLEQKS
jgi:hypothetical protein